MQIYFGYFGHAWLHSSKMIVSPCRRLPCLSICKKWTSSFTSFLRYYILKILQFDWLAAFWSITEDPKFLQIYWWNINNNIYSFHFRLFTRKPNMTKFFEISKKPYFGAILCLFCPNFGKNEFSWKKSSVNFSIFILSTIVPKLRKT